MRRPRACVPRAPLSPDPAGTAGDLLGGPRSAGGTRGLRPGSRPPRRYGLRGEALPGADSGGLPATAGGLPAGHRPGPARPRRHRHWERQSGTARPGPPPAPRTRLGTVSGPPRPRARRPGRRPGRPGTAVPTPAAWNDAAPAPHGQPVPRPAAPTRQVVRRQGPGRGPLFPSPEATAGRPAGCRRESRPATARTARRAGPTHIVSESHSGNQNAFVDAEDRRRKSLSPRTFG